MKKQPTEEQRTLSQGIAEEFQRFYEEKSEIQDRKEWDSVRDDCLQRSMNDYQGGK